MSKLKNKEDKMKHLVDIKIYKKKRNYSVRLKRQAKVKYNNLSSKKYTKPIWGKCKPYFYNKYSWGDTNIIAKEKGDVLLKMT